MSSLWERGQATRISLTESRDTGLPGSQSGSARPAKGAFPWQSPVAGIAQGAKLTLSLLQTRRFAGSPTTGCCCLSSGTAWQLCCSSSRGTKPPNPHCWHSLTSASVPAEVMPGTWPCPCLELSRSRPSHCPSCCVSAASGPPTWGNTHAEILLAHVFCCLFFFFFPQGRPKTALSPEPSSQKRLSRSR